MSWKVCERLEEERRSREELRGGLEKEKEELRANLRDATNEVRGHFAIPHLHLYHLSSELRKVFVLAGVQAGVSDEAARQERKGGL